MIMGAGIYQVPLIKKAKEMGLETLVVSIAGNYPGILLADRFYEIDTRDQDGVLAIAKKEKISGICTSGTDVAVKTIGYVNEKMGLNGISYMAASRVTDKAAMKSAFIEHGVSTAAFVKTASVEEAKRAAEKIGYPVMVKAVDSSGSRGVKKAENESDMLSAYAEAMEVTKKDYVLIEEYIVADEIGVDGYIGSDEAKVILPHQKYVCSVNGVTIPSGHAFPYEGTPDQIHEIEVQITKAANAVGLKNCPFNADVFVRDGKVWIIEMGGRTGATCIPELISIYEGYDWYEKIILGALGEQLEFDSISKTPCMAKLLFSQENGIIKEIDSVKIQDLQEKTEEICLDYRVGEHVEAVHNGTDRIGHLIMSNVGEEELDAKLDQLMRVISIKKDTD